MTSNSVPLFSYLSHFLQQKSGDNPFGWRKQLWGLRSPGRCFMALHVFEVGSPPSRPLAPREETFTHCNSYQSLFASAAILIIYSQKLSFQKNLQDVPWAHLCIFKKLLADAPRVNDEIEWGNKDLLKQRSKRSFITLYHRILLGFQLLRIHEIQGCWKWTHNPYFYTNIDSSPCNLTVS